jgi:fumarate reductase subunit D
VRERSNEPFFWALFSAGGMISALVLPALVFVLWIAGPLGWIDPPSFVDLSELVRRPLVRMGLLILIALCLVHWGHRFRFTLYDGLQLKHLFGLIAAICYGGATILTLIAAYLLWNFPG